MSKKITVIIKVFFFIDLIAYLELFILDFDLSRVCLQNNHKFIQIIKENQQNVQKKTIAK